MGFKENLKNSRIENGFTQKKLAEMLGLSKNSICEWEKGRCEPSIEMLKKISEIFHIDLNSLLELDETSLSKPVLTKVNLSVPEKELLRVYRSLSDNGKNTLIGSAHNIERFDPQAIAAKKA